MANKHLLKLDQMPTVKEFMSDTWASRLDYVGLVANEGGGGTDEVFYNFDDSKVTILKVKIENPGNYGLGCISGDISEDNPTIIDWGNGTTTKLTTPITNNTEARNSTDFYVNYSKPGEYIISIDGWYDSFRCNYAWTKKSGVTQINEVLIEIVQVSSLITSFDYTFYECLSLTEIPAGLFDKNTSATNFQQTFSGCKSLTSIPSGLFDKNINVTNFLYTFAACSNLTSIPPKLFDENINVANFHYTFNACSGLTGIPSGLFDKNTKVTNFRGIFNGCSSLTGETPYTSSSDGKKIKLWQRDKENGFTKPQSFNMAFYGCTKLTDYADIPNNWKQ